VNGRLSNDPISVQEVFCCHHRNCIEVSFLLEQSLYGEECGEFVVSTLISVYRERGKLLK